MDDTLIIANKNYITEILNSFNSKSKLKFTMEEESNNSINFLNINIHRNNIENRIIISSYHKKTQIGSYLNYYSDHPMRYKISTIKGLIHIAMSTNNSKQKLNQELASLTQKLIKN